MWVHLCNAGSANVSYVDYRSSICLHDVFVDAMGFMWTCFMVSLVLRNTGLGSGLM